MLETRQITKTFGGVRAVDELSISVERGKITALVGPNGSGKTTLINVLSGVLPIDGGTVAIGGMREFSRLRPYQVASYGITRTFQEVRLFEQLPVLDNVLVVLTPRGVLASLRPGGERQRLDKAEALLRRVGLWEKRNELARTLSYGQRKLLEIARALATDGDIFLFDEPFAGLFPQMVQTIAGIVRSLKEDGKTVVLIEHDMGVIRQLADHIIVMDEGKLLAEGEPAEVLTRREVIEAYLGS
jgi:ABC-type branched-subunit amino acid transport system ATPase component